MRKSTGNQVSDGQAPVSACKATEVPLLSKSNPEPSREGDSGKWLQCNPVVNRTIATIYFWVLGY